MTTTALKKEIVKAIDTIDDESFLEAIYTIINNRNPLYTYNMSDEDKNILNEREIAYKSGKAKVYSKEQVRKMLAKGPGK